MLAAGCHTPLIDTTIINRGPALQLLEFDYPSASFGVNALPAGGLYHYRFRVQDSGLLTLHYQDSAGHTRSVDGPTVRQGQEGTLTVTVGEPNVPVRWDLKLEPGR